MTNSLQLLAFGLQPSAFSLQPSDFLAASMLREMRDAAGDSGEFYTPRAVVRFMVAVTDPRLGESVLDPVGGTSGFLAIRAMSE